LLLAQLCSLDSMNEDGRVGLPVFVRAIERDAIANRHQVSLREVGLHKSHGVLDGITGDLLHEALQSALRRRHPHQHLLRQGHALRLDYRQQGIQLVSEAIKLRPLLDQLGLDLLAVLPLQVELVFRVRLPALRSVTKLVQLLVALEQASRSRTLGTFAFCSSASPR